MGNVYLNGRFVPPDQALISADDRGFLLSDGVYEVIPFYEGVPLFMDRHLQRLRRSLDALRIEYDTTGLDDVLVGLVKQGALGDEARSLTYLQITRGVAPRTHYFPTQPVEPTVYAFAKAWSRPADEVWNRGFTAATVADRRWTRLDIKSISLLGNVLAFQEAIDRGADDAILVRDGVAIEGAHQNFWGVFDGVAVTHPATNLILSGITRGAVIELAEARGMPVEQRPIFIEDLASAEELFFTGTTGEVRPCVRVDGKQVGDGRVGPVTRALSDAFLAHVREAKEAATVGR